MSFNLMMLGFLLIVCAALAAGARRGMFSEWAWFYEMGFFAEYRQVNRICRTTCWFLLASCLLLFCLTHRLY